MKTIGSQLRRTILIESKRYPRVPYGSETRPWSTTVPCHDCDAIAGQLHAHDCDVEECPRCGTQLVSCDCDNRGEVFESKSVKDEATNSAHFDNVISAKE
jgi:hypothetical protein